MPVGHLILKLGRVGRRVLSAIDLIRTGRDSPGRGSGVSDVADKVGAVRGALAPLLDVEERGREDDRGRRQIGRAHV